MKIIGISDMHGQLPDPGVFPEGDVLCIAGDISPLKAQRNPPQMISWLRKRFINWIEDLPIKKVFLVAGNHDFVFENPEFKEEAISSLNILSTKITYLEDSSAEYEGKVFYGSPWVIGPKGWAFYDEDLDNIVKTMPIDADVCIFHQPLCFGNNGRVLQVPSWMIGKTISFPVTDEFFHPDYGSAILDELAILRHPKIILTGHVHSGNHNISELFNTKIINVSILDEDYKIKYNPFEISI